MKITLKTSEDGSHTLMNEEIQECYHSSFGAFTEANHIFIKNAFHFSDCNPVNILEIGFGTGLNAFLTFIESEKSKRKTNYQAVELYPVGPEIVKQLNYPYFEGKSSSEVFYKMHEIPWNQNIEINTNFCLQKIQENLILFEPKQFYDVVYFDAFSPEKQPELWNAEIFKKIYNNLNPGAVFITYCVKGTVKRALKEVGFSIELLDGPPGKRHILRAIK